MIWKPAQMKVDISENRMGHLIIQPVSERRARHYAKLYREWHGGEEGESSVYVQEDYNVEDTLQDLGLTSSEISDVGSGWDVRKMVSVDTFEHMFGAFNQVPME
jgi:hypothetical protein